MEEEVYALLDAAVSFPIAWGALPEGTGKQRAHIYRASETQEQMIDTAGLITARVNVDCYGESYADAVTASRAIRSALNRYQGGSIRGAFFEGARDFTDDDAGLLHRIGLTFLVTYAET